MIVGVVGTLQFDVFEYRMKNEYGVDLYMTGLPYDHLRLITACPCKPEDLVLCTGSAILEDFRNRLLVAFGGTVVAGIIGIILGLIAGYFGGIVDSVIMRIMDGMLAFPYILLAIILMTVLGSGIFNVILAIGIGNVPSFARVVRGEVHIIKNEEYCNAARVIGVSNTRMLLTHILPNTISPLIVYATLGIAGAIISEAALSFLGLGISEPTASWGSILQTGKNWLNNYPYIATYSGLFILITVLGFNLLGDGVRDVLDPKMKK